MKSSILIVSSALLFLFWQQKTPNSTSSEKPDQVITKQQLIEEALQERIKMFEQQRIKQCRLDAYKEAASIVDSTLIARARAARANQINRPPIPPKPQRPDILKAKDTTDVKPFIVN